MRLASLEGGRDGRLVVLAPTLDRAVAADHLAPTLQAALDEWEHVAAALDDLSQQLVEGQIAGETVNPYDVMAPLPRAYQWIDGSAYINHVELVRRARGAEMPQRFYSDPLMYQGVSSPCLGPRAPIALPQIEDWGVDFEGEVAVITGDVPCGVPADEAAQYIRLVTIVNDVSLRLLISDELAKGFGFLQSKPPCAFAPAAVTPDALGPAWDGGKLHAALHCSLNGEPFGCPDAGRDMTFDFGVLISHAAKSRPLGAGTIIGSGTVSNKLEGGPGKRIKDGGVGYSCIAEQRMIETIEQGQPKTPFLKAGDRVRIEARAADGQSLFGVIDQQVAQIIV